MCLFISQFLESDFILRNPELHEYHCGLLDGIIGEEDSVNHESNVNKIDDFHVANTQLPQDMMHVILDGFLHLETHLLLSSFVNNEKLFTLDFLSQRIMKN